jgi:thiamine biosynthesis lipoprotein
MKRIFMASLLALSTCIHAAWHSDTQTIMGTRVHAELWHTDAAVAREVLDAVMAEMRRIDVLMSVYKDASDLSRMNREAGFRPVRVSEEILWVLQLSERISKLTAGAFDVTYASAGRYYDYRKGVRPDDATLARAVDAIDYRYVVVDAERGLVSYKHPEVYVDLGGIAKGYAVDRCIAIFGRYGIRHGMVAAGGDSRIVGDRRGKPWTVGIKHPRDPQRMAALLPLSDTAVSTSGDYERYFEADGVRYHHILDPKTGDSARRVRSVTILGSDASLTDALSTSVFVLGLEGGLALVNTLEGIDAIIVDAHGELHFSDGLEGLE